MFIVLISLLHKIIKACQNEIHGIVAYSFLSVGPMRKKLTSFCQALKRYTRNKIGSFFASRCILYFAVQVASHNTLQQQQQRPFNGLSHNTLDNSKKDRLRQSLEF